MPPGAPDAVLAHAAAGFDRHLERVRAFVRQPSVSATGEGMDAMARLVVTSLTELGACAELVATDGWPVVVGELDEGQPRTLLLYGMYDVQPVAGERWCAAPFGGEIVELPDLGPSLVSRGVYNSKGPLAGVLSAIASVREAAGRLPVNVRFLVEGEEELASRSLPAFLRAHSGRLACDGVYSPFYGQDRRGTPIVKLGFKGVQFLELTCRGGAWGGPTRQGIHGAEAAWIASPAWHLVRTLATMVDGLDRSVVAGLPAQGTPTDEDEALLRPLAERFDAATVLEQQQVARMKHAGGSLAQLRHYLFDSAINIDGIAAGHAGEGTKSLLPHEATAKLSVRLVPGMPIDEVRARLAEHVERVGGGAVEVRFLDGYPPARTPSSAPIAQALIEACRIGDLVPEVWPTHGGAAPFSVLAEALGRPLVCGGLGHGGRQHAPDEYATVSGMRLFERSVIEFLYRFAAIDRSSTLPT